MTTTRKLYTRWFEYGSFLPIFRAHGSRLHNEVWSYGKAAEPILEKYLKLRYQLMPYIYSLAYRTHESGGSVYARALHGFPTIRRWPAWATSTCSEPRFCGPSHRTGSHQPNGLPAGRRGWYNYWTKPACPRRADDRG